MQRVIRNKPDQNQVDQTNRRYAYEYMEAKKAAEDFETRRKSLREIILGRIRQYGEPDQDGNVWLPALDHLLKAERRSSKKFDAEAAEKWLKENGWWDEAKVTVPEQVIPAHDVIDEDALSAFIYRKRDDSSVPNDLPDEVYNEKETFALKVTKETQYDY